ncbi:symporter small accessory protein [Anaerohalosphaeraceae bacterium U12dextr]
MLGIEDKGVVAAYLLCIVSAGLCVVYGLLNWNRGDEPVEPDDVKWVAEEKKVEEKF